jgi:predicted dehydrogenase
MKPVKLGIVGTGAAARYFHWPVLKEMKDKFEIAAICDETDYKVFEVGRLMGGVPTKLNHKEILSMPEVEAVVIATQVNQVRQIALESLKAKKHIIIEKPLGANLVESREIASYQERFPDQVMMIAENFRYAPVLNKIKELIGKGEIGIPYALVWSVQYRGDLRERPIKTPWRPQLQNPGSSMTDAGIHYIAGLRSVMGDIVSGTAFIGNINPLVSDLETMNIQCTIRSKKNRESWNWGEESIHDIDITHKQDKNKQAQSEIIHNSSEVTDVSTEETPESNHDQGPVNWMRSELMDKAKEMVNRSSPEEKKDEQKNETENDIGYSIEDILREEEERTRREESLAVIGPAAENISREEEIKRALTYNLGQAGTFQGPPVGGNPKNYEVQGIINLFFTEFGMTEDKLLIFGNMGLIVAHTGIGEQWIIIKRPNESDEKFSLGTEKGYKGAYENFYGAIRWKQNIVSTFHESLKDFEILVNAQSEAEKERRTKFLVGL